MKPDPDNYIPLLYNSPSLTVDGDWETTCNRNDKAIADPCDFIFDFRIDLTVQSVIDRITLVGTSDVDNAKALSRFSHLKVKIIDEDEQTVNEEKQEAAPYWEVGSQPSVAIDFTEPNNVGRYIQVSRYLDDDNPNIVGTDFIYINSLDAAGRTYDLGLSLAEIEVYGEPGPEPLEPPTTTAYTPDPYDGETGVVVSKRLSWLEPNEYIPVFYDFYLDPDEADVIANSKPNCEYSRLASSETWYEPLVYEEPLLTFGTTYYWKVIAYEPNDPGEPFPLIPHEGPIWSFTTENVVQVDAGPNIITWLDGGTATVDLNGSVTYVDGGTPDGTLWSVGSQPSDSIVNFDNPTLETTSADFDTMGTYVLKLWAEGSIDAGVYEGEDTVAIQVYANACGAAKASPSYTPLPHDSNNDCREDLEDFIPFAVDWLKDLSLTENVEY